MSRNEPTLVLVAIAVVVFFYLMNPNYLSIENIRGIMHAASLTGVLAIGMSCLIIGGQIDLSAGALGAACGMFLTIISNAGVNWVLAFVFVILIGGMMGAINALLVVKLDLKAFIATLGMSTALQGFAKVLSNSTTIPLKDSGSWIVGSMTVAGIPMPFIITAVLFVIYGVVLSKTKLGRKIYMVGGNSSAARLAGINTKKMHTLLYINNGLLCGLAAAVYTSRARSGAPIAIVGKEFDAITIAVLGGVAFTGGAGGMAGCFIGLILINSFNFGLSVVRVPSYWQTIAQGLLLILALTLDFIRERSRIRTMHASTAEKAVG
jgi:ribose transport system permease protein